MKSDQSLSSQVVVEPKTPQSAQTFYLAEYSALRDEIIRRMEWQHQILGLVLAAASAIVSFGDPSLMLTSPILFLLLSTLWINYDTRIAQLGKYIYNRIELGFVGPPGAWEASSEREGIPEHWGWLGSLERFSARGLLVGSQIAVVLIGWARTGWSLDNTPLLSLDLLIVLLTLLIMIGLVPDFARGKQKQ